VYIWDALTGAPAGTLPLHRALVRDCSMHPSNPGEMATVSWDGSVVLWGPGAAEEGDAGVRPPRLEGDQMA
jgi:WD repeat-containing protein 23